MKNNFIVLKGDGIGPEIMNSALKILEEASKKTGFEYEYQEIEFGGESIDKYGIPFNEKLKKEINNNKAILLAAIGGPKWANNKITPENGLLELRKELDAFANIRPVKVNKNLAKLSPLKEEIVKDVDLVIIRELTGGAYFGKPKNRTKDLAFDTMIYSKEEIERIVRYAFEIARKRRKKLTSVDKANVLESSKLWREIVNNIALEYTDVEVNHMYVDAAAMALITYPSSFDTIVTENLFGDILSDEASVLSGSLGMLYSSSFGSKIPLYEPAHGSAPDIANQNIANPIAMILSMTQMLKLTFNQDNLAEMIEKAVDKTIENNYLTKDLNKDNYVTTEEFTNKVIQYL